MTDQPTGRTIDMAKYAPADWVLLRSGKYGQIKAVLNDDDMAMNAIYDIRLYPSTAKIVLDGLKIISRLAPHQAERVRLGLSELECDAIDQYTGGAYKAWNEGLRTAGTRNLQIDAVVRVLARLPKYSRTVHRALGFDNADDHKAFKAKFMGQAYTTPQFLSTSASTNVLDRFDGGSFRVWMKIHTAGRNGATLRVITGTNDLNEQEILFPPGATFSVAAPPVDINDKHFTVELMEEGAVRAQPRGKYAVVEIPTRKATVAKEKQ
ncbi:ADP-ribosyltransferase [Variovorax sp. J22R133]|uniref:ADP-ribosyltransferase n=1 Tax=Variovorax brevis TaxID=3053503 RepID=UPI002575FCA7|nr:ADP-ribosyltransferase [Variovorax sp. J22R133]MDM0113073.1 ADP-ribosyltransferase [Variovorax sp. J22R133]